MVRSSFFDAVEARDMKLALEILDKVVKAATKKASEETKAAGLSVYDGRLKRWIGPDEPDPYADLRSSKADLRVTKTKRGGRSG